MSGGPTGNSRGEQGVALIIAVLLLLLVSGIGIAAIEHAGEDYMLTGRGRSATTALYAADAGIEFAKNRIAQPVPDTSPFTVTMQNGTAVRSGSKSDVGAQPIDQGGPGQPPQGYELNIGTGFSSKLYTANATGTAPGGSTAELEARLSRFQSNRSY